jgi:hypothetical protein
MERSSIYGVALIAGSLGGVVTMIFHPTGHDLLAQADQIARRNETITVASHSLALVSIPVLLFGFSGLSRRLGWNRPPTAAAFIAYAFGAAAAMCATVINGLAGPVLTRQILSADEPARQVLNAVLLNNTMLNQAFSKVFAAASSTGIALWSVSILKSGSFPRSVGIIGCVVGAVGLVGLLTGYLRMNVHGFGLLVFAESVWTIMVGLFLCRRDDSPTN